MSFGLPRRDKVDLGVFDIQGRQVATLARGVMDPGVYTRSWDGTIGGGQKAGPGVYFYRLRVGSETYSLRGVKLN
jgi:hypothetical protein